MAVDWDEIEKVTGYIVSFISDENQFNPIDVFSIKEGDSTSETKDYVTYNSAAQTITINIEDVFGNPLLEKEPVLKWETGNTVSLSSDWEGIGTKEASCTIDALGFSENILYGTVYFKYNSQIVSEKSANEIQADIIKLEFNLVKSMHGSGNKKDYEAAKDALNLIRSWKTTLEKKISPPVVKTPSYNNIRSLVAEALSQRLVLHEDYIASIAKMYYTALSEISKAQQNEQTPILETWKNQLSSGLSQYTSLIQARASLIQASASLIQASKETVVNVYNEVYTGS